MCYFLLLKKQSDQPTQLSSIHILPVKLFVVRFELERDEKMQEVFAYFRACEIKVLELKVWFSI